MFSKDATIASVIAWVSTTATLLSLPASARNSSSSGSTTEVAAVTRAAAAGDRALFSAVVTPAGQTPIKISANFTGKAASRMLVASTQAHDLAVPHSGSLRGEPLSVVNVGGGVTNYETKSVTVSGSTATVVATCDTWLDTNVVYPDGTKQTFTPRQQDETDTLSLQRGRDGVWRVSDFAFRFKDGSP